MQRTLAGIKGWVQTTMNFKQVVRSYVRGLKDLGVACITTWSGLSRYPSGNDTVSEDNGDNFNDLSHHVFYSIEATLQSKVEYSVTQEPLAMAGTELSVPDLDWLSARRDLHFSGELKLCDWLCFSSDESDEDFARRLLQNCHASAYRR